MGNTPITLFAWVMAIASQLSAFSRNRVGFSASIVVLVIIALTALASPASALSPMPGQLPGGTVAEEKDADAPSEEHSSEEDTYSTVTQEPCGDDICTVATDISGPDLTNEVKHRVCKVFTGFDDLCISDLDGDGSVTYADFDLWASENLGEFACAELRFDYDYRHSSPVFPLGSVARDQFESLHFDTQGSSCWGLNSKGEHVVVRSYHPNGALAGHWERDSGNGYRFLRRWTQSEWGAPKLPATDREKAAWPFMSRAQEYTVWWAINERSTGVFSTRGFELQGCEPSDDYGEGLDKCQYRLNPRSYHPSVRDSASNIRVDAYTDNGFLVAVVAFETESRSKPIVEAWSWSNGNISLAVYDGCSVDRSEINRLGVEVSTLNAPACPPTVLLPEPVEPPTPPELEEPMAPTVDYSPR